MLVAFALTLGIAAQASAAGTPHNRYKWKDAQGNLHFDDVLPTEALQLGYEVVNSQGIVVKHVNRAKTTEEMKADDEAAAKLATQKHATEVQAKSDQQVLAAYPNEHELVSAQQAQLDMMDQNIHSTEISLQSQEKSLTAMANRCQPHCSHRSSRCGGMSKSRKPTSQASSRKRLMPRRSLSANWRTTGNCRSERRQSTRLRPPRRR
jgi:hypothetical protein